MPHEDHEFYERLRRSIIEGEPLSEKDREQSLAEFRRSYHEDPVFLAGVDRFLEGLERDIEDPQR